MPPHYRFRATIMAAPSVSSEPLSLYPLLFLAAAFALGIILATYYPIPLKLSLPAAVVAGYFSLHYLRRREHARATYLILVAFALAGAALATVETWVARGATVQQLYDGGSIASGGPVEITGEVLRAPEPTPDGFFLLLGVENLRYRQVDHAVSGKVRLFAPVTDAATLDQYTRLEPRYGARLRILVALRRTDMYRNPGVTAFTEFLDHRGYDATGTIKHPALVDRLDDRRVFLPLAWLYEIRQRLAVAVVQRFDPDTAGVLAASMLGNRYFLSQGTTDRFRSGGTFHVLIISGLHISVLGLIVLWIMRRFTSDRWWQYLVPVAVVWGYTGAVGADAAIVRAALMFTVGAAAFVILRTSSGLNALGGVGLLLLVVRPAELFSPSFQLTFVAVLAIVGSAIPLLRKMSAIGKWRPTVATPVPPTVPTWLRNLCEILFWSDRTWRAEQARSAWKCRLFKSKLAARLEPWRLQWVIRYLFEGALVSVCVQLALLPFLIVYFHRLAPVSLVLNVFVGLLMSLLSVTALLAMLVSLASTSAAAPLTFAANKINWLLVHVSDPFLRSRWASWRLPEYSGGKSWIYVAYLAVVVLLGYLALRWDPFAQNDTRSESALLHRRLRVFTALAFVLLASVIVAHPFSAAGTDGRLRVDFLDVGQGDSILVNLPDGTRFLIDGGGEPKYRGDAGDAGDASAPHAAFQRDERTIGEAVVSEYLWYRGFDRIDYVIATHADTDHMDGLNAVVRNFQVNAAFVGTAPQNDADYLRFTDRFRERAVPLYQLKRNDVMRFGNVTLEFLWPDRATIDPSTTENNRSIVVRITLGNRRFLLTGDIERITEEQLAASPETLACDVLKVAHHGSRSSSSEKFLAAAHPQMAVISVGRTSIFGHPHAEALERLRASAARIMTTGRSGTISISTNGNDLIIEEFVPGGS
jgi:competence protein ComEC